MTVDWTPEQIADVLNRFQFVAWDRMVDSRHGENDQDRTIVVYGWIGRPDGHHDFLDITFVSWTDEVGFTTSSAARSAEITAILFGPEAPHVECQRVEDQLAGLVHRRVARK